MNDSNVVDQRESAHPDAQRLREFGLGQLTSEEASQLEEHVETCDECCRTLRAVPDDGFVSVLKSVDTECLLTGGIDTNTSDTRDDELPPALRDHPRYRIVEPLGRGGMGVVFKAEHRLMQRMVALKVIHPRLVTRPEAVERFQREVRAAARLSHPNIVTAHDAEQAEDVHFLVMEFVEGESVQRLIQREDRLPQTQAIDLARQAAAGLAAAHEYGMVHRDIKPANLMVTPDGTVKILDFGLSRFVVEQAEPLEAGLTTEAMLLGTPDYMAPEQARDCRTADIRADIYSLGCTLYHMLTGQPPFAGQSAVETLASHFDRAPAKLEELRPDVFAVLAAVVRRMMARAVDERFQTPQEIMDALERIDTSASDQELLTDKQLRPQAVIRSRVVVAASGIILITAAAFLSNGFGWLKDDSTPTQLDARDAGPSAFGEATTFTDDFAAAELSGIWRVDNPGGGLINQTDGQLRLEPDASVAWFNDSRGQFVWQSVTGDFAAGVQIEIRGHAGQGTLPAHNFNAAGIVALAPDSDGPDDRWVMVGLGRQRGTLGTHVAITQQSHSLVDYQKSRSASGELRLTRSGNRLSAWRKLTDEEQWTLLAEHEFESLPDTLQIGPAATAWKEADLHAIFNRFVLQPE